MITAEQFLTAEGKLELSMVLFYDEKTKTAKDSFCELLERYAKKKLQEAIEEIDSKLIDKGGQALDGYELATNDGLLEAIQILDSK